MSWTALAADLTSSTFGVLCLASALPFVGIPFPTRSSATYYAGKNQWLAQLSGNRLTNAQAGYLGAALRIVIGTCLIYQPAREPALWANGAVVTQGTIFAIRDKRPLVPQFGMLTAIGVCLLLDRYRKAGY